MRYITPNANKILFNNNGTEMVRFKQGVHVVGTAACGAAAHLISYSGMQRNWATDLDGLTVTTAEMCGLGSLSGMTKTGATLSDLSFGVRDFYEAPPISGGTNLVALAGGIYKVLTGNIGYNGVTYEVNDTFIRSGAVTVTVGGGTFGAYYITHECDEFLDEHFKIKDMLVGDEALDYFEWDAYGFDPKNSAVTADTDYWGWTR